MRANSINRDVPFYSNTSDDTHCVQAAYKMIAEYFRPNLRMSFEEWDKITQKKEGGWTWTMAGLLWFKRNGFEIVDIEPFDYKKFAEQGKEYLRELWGDEIATVQEEKSDLQQAQETAREFVEEIRVDERKPTLDEIKKFLDDGYLVALNVNVRTLNSKDGYAGHFLVVKGFDDEGFYIQDPGLPAMENRRVDFNLFYTAWAYPNEDALNLIAIRTSN